MLFGLSYTELAWTVGAVLGSALVSGIIAAAFLVRLPADHFVRDAAETSEERPVALRVLWVMLRNLLGLALVVVGALLSLPGVPGQGLLTILVGLLLLDWPGKRRLLLRLVRRPRLRRTIDRLRSRFGRPALVVERRSEGSEGAHEAETAGADN